MFIVIEVYEREIGHYEIVVDREKAIDRANELLKEHLSDIDCEEAIISPDEFTGEMEFADEQNMNAWSNIHDCNYDCHILAL